MLCQGQAFNPEVGQCGDFDLLVATVLFENGVVAIVDNGRKSSQAYDQRLEVSGLYVCVCLGRDGKRGGGGGGGEG